MALDHPDRARGRRDARSSADSTIAKKWRFAARAPRLSEAIFHLFALLINGANGTIEKNCGVLTWILSVIVGGRTIYNSPLRLGSNGTHICGGQRRQITKREINNALHAWGPVAPRGPPPLDADPDG